MVAFEEKLMIWNFIKICSGRKDLISACCVGFKKISLKVILSKKALYVFSYKGLYIPCIFLGTIELNSD